MDEVIAGRNRQAPKFLVSAFFIFLETLYFYPFLEEWKEKEKGRIKKRIHPFPGIELSIATYYLHLLQSINIIKEKCNHRQEIELDCICPSNAG
jgi:hypothetical protein